MPKKIQMEYINKWLFDEEPFESFDIGEFSGFIYVITNKLNGKMYIGKKFFWFKRKNSKGKRRIKESNWKDYYGSSKELLLDVISLGKANFIREIISLHIDERDVNYCEIKEQFNRNVLEAKNINGERLYYNLNIASKYFVRPEFVSEDIRRKLSKSHLGQIVTEEARLKISTANKGVSKPLFTEEHKQNNPNSSDSTFVINNPNSFENWVAIVLFPHGEEQIFNFKKWCIDNSVNYTALISWSKKHKDDTLLHPKFKIKFISIRKI